MSDRDLPDDAPPAPRLERAVLRPGERALIRPADRALAPVPTGDRALIAALVSSSVAIKRERVTRSMAYGGSMAAVALAAVSWPALPLVGLVGAQWWWHRRQDPRRAPGPLSLFETPERIARIAVAAHGPWIVVYTVTARDGLSIALYGDARRRADTLAAMQRLAPAADVVA